jgi:hypothetical protein
MADLPSAEELQAIREWKGLTTPERKLLALIDALADALEDLDRSWCAEIHNDNHDQVGPCPLCDARALLARIRPNP